MTPSVNCYNLIKKFEGCRLDAYQDPVGIWYERRCTNRILKYLEYQTVPLSCTAWSQSYDRDLQRRRCKNLQRH
jgi:GH24 family phage-related lysozyme (muramidase)